MNIFDKLKKNNLILYIILWSSLFIISIIIFSFGIGNESLSTDEGFTYAVTNNSFKEIIKICMFDYSPPLFYLITKLFTLVFGNSIISLRFFSLLGTLLLLFLSIGPVRRIFGKFGSIVYLILIIILPAFSFTSQQANMLSWASFFITASILYGFLIIKFNKITDWIILGLLSIGSCYIHYYALVIITFLYIFLIVYFSLTDRKKLIPVIILSLIVIIFFIPWISTLKYQMGQIIKRYWIPKINYFSVMESLSYIFNGKSRGVTNYAGFVLFLVLLYYAVRLSILEKNKDCIILYMSLIIYILTFLFIYIFSKMVKSVFFPPYFHSVSGVPVIIFVYTLKKLKKVKTTMIVCLFLLLITLPASISIRTVNVNDPITQAITYLKLNMKQDDVILHTNDNTASALTYYFPNNKHFLFMHGYFKGYMNYKAFNNNLTVSNDVKRFLNKSKNVWIITRNENFIPFNYYKSVVYNEKYIMLENPEIFEHLNSPVTVELFKFSE